MFAFDFDFFKYCDVSCDPLKFYLYCTSQNFIFIDHKNAVSFFSVYNSKFIPIFLKQNQNLKN